MDEITISRQLSDDEAHKRLMVARHAIMVPILGWTLGGAVIAMVLIIGLMTRSVGWTVGVSLGFVVLVGGAVALGLMLGNDVMRRQARYELGQSGVLTVTWSGSGGSVTAENFRRSFGYHEIQWVREIDGLLVLKFPMQWHPSPYAMAFAQDFAPAEVRQRIVAAGARVR